MKEQFECPYCGEHFNRPERYLKPAHTFFVITEMYCSSCRRKWLEYGIEKPVYLGYSLPEKIEFNDDNTETKLIFPYRNDIINLLNEYESKVLLKSFLISLTTSFINLYV